jgi:hypothetical protein
VLEVVVLPERIDATRLSEKVNENSPSNYNLNVSLSEKSRSAEALVLNFQLELTTPQQTAKITVSGTATLKGSKEEIQAGISAPDENKPPHVLQVIYDRTYGAIYLLATSLRVPQPLPNLLKKGT